MVKNKFVSVVSVILTAMMLTACAGLYDKGVGPGTLSSHPFPEEHLLTDPQLVHGVLSNGMGYVLLHNTTPEDRVSMHLNVQSGSMHEQDDQQGLAHYLEHMLFNGSTHFKPGELIEYFQSIGMMFGGDANAHTGFFETVYDILLPKGDRESLEKGLLVLQDYAEGALLLESEVERERGVVLAEKRERDSVSFRTFQASLGFELPDSRISKRLPIGVESVLETADRSLLKAYYDAWYRPDNMMIVMVGDFDIATAKSLIEDRFSSIKPRAPRPELPENRWIAHDGDKAFYHYEPEAGGTDVSIGTASWVPFDMETEAGLKQRVVTRLADMMVQNRLSKDVRRQDSPFSNAGIYSGTFLQNVRFSAISGECSSENWQETLARLEQTLRQVLTHGFTALEMKRVKADFILGLKTAVEKASTRKSTPLSRQLVSSINKKRFFMSPRQEMELLKPYIESLTLEQFNTAFADTWASEHRLIQVTGNAVVIPMPDVGSEKNASDSESASRADTYGNITGTQEQHRAAAEKMILAAWHESREHATASIEDDNTLPFPYLPRPDESRDFLDNLILSDTTLNDLGIRVVQFKNRVRLNIKKTDFKKGELIFRVDFGDGHQSEPREKPGLALVSRAVLNESGVGGLTLDELETALAGRNVNVHFQMNDSAFQLSGSASPDEVELLFQLLHTRMVDPAFRRESLVLFKERYAQMFQKLTRTPDGMMGYEGERFLAGGDSRFGMPTMAQVNDIDVDDVKAWLQPSLKSGEIEISIVGDMDVDQVISAASTYFATLPPREAPILGMEGSSKASHSSGLLPSSGQGVRLPVFPKGKKVKLPVDSRLDKALVVMAFPTDDFWNIGQTRRLNILAKLFSERLRKVLREEMGATYSPHAYNQSSRVYDGYGVLRGVVAVAPDRVDDVVGHMDGIAHAFVGNTLTQKELDLVLEPILTYIKDLVKTNGYWLNSVLAGSGIHPEKLEWAGTILDDYRSISVAEVSDIASRFLKQEDSARIVIQPLPESD